MPGAWFYDLVYRFGAPWELGVRDELPRMSFSGASRMAPGLEPGLEPGEMERLFGAEWQIEHLAEFSSDRQEAVFLMTRHPVA